MFYSKPWLDALIVLLVVLLFFGPKRLPTLGRSLGHGFREFKDGITGASKPDEDEERPALNSAQSAQAPTAGQPSPVAEAPPAQTPASSPPAAESPAPPPPPAAVAAQPPSPPQPESAEVAPSEQRS
jgi:TatA/E family protein of Tat protein translocase